MLQSDSNIHKRYVLWMATDSVKMKIKTFHQKKICAFEHITHAIHEHMNPPTDRVQLRVCVSVLPTYESICRSKCKSIERRPAVDSIDPNCMLQHNVL